MDSIIEKIEKLLAKAESTDSAPEAEALLAKAQQMIIKHEIDEAMLGQRKTSDVPTSEVFVLTKTRGHGAKSLVLLLNTVANANSCRVFTSGNKYHQATVSGFPADIERVRMMFSALHMQLLTSELNSRATKPSWEHGTTWTISFYEGFVMRMHQRLTEAKANAQAEATAQWGSGAELVLVDKDRQVDQWMRNEHGPMRRQAIKSGAKSGNGYAAGKAAANRSDIGNTRVGGAARALT